MKYCYKCGNPMEDDMLFCQKCGTKVLEQPTQNEATRTYAKKIQMPRQIKHTYIISRNRHNHTETHCGKA